MRRNTQCILALLFLICSYACENKSYPQLFAVVDSLTNVNPDSAIVLLRSMEHSMESASKATQMYYQLLCIKANDKAYIGHTSDSLIVPVLHYYIEKKDKRHLPEVYYYTGRVYRDLGDAPQALDYFEKATDAIEKDADYPLKSRICSQMGTLFMYQEMYAEASDKFKEAYQYDVLLKDSAGMVFDLRDIAGASRCMNDMEASLSYYQEAYDLASLLQHQRLMDIVQNQMANLYIQLKQYDLAKKNLQPSLNNLHRTSKSAVYSIASKLYHQTGNIDSAHYYYKELLDCGTIYAKQAAHRGLAEIALSRKNSEDAWLHLRSYMQCVDSIQEITDTETIRKMRSLYNYQLREKENILLKAENSRKAIVIVCVLTISFILITLSFAYLQYNRRKRLLLQIQLDKLHRLKEEQHRKSSQFIEENKRLIEELENRLQNAGQINSSLNAQLQKQKEIILYTNKQAKIDLSEREEAQIVLFDSDIYNLFKEQIRSDLYKVTEENWEALEEAINDTYSGFSGNLRKLHRLSKHEFRVCLLIKINIFPADMAKLTNHTKESISATRRRLYEKVFLEKGNPKQWDDFILSL